MTGGPDISFSMKNDRPSNSTMYTYGREKSAWNNHGMMRKYLSLLGKCFGNVAKERYVILLLDGHRCHPHESVLAHAKRWGIRLVYMPAHMTGLLQPCDTHVFAKLKAAFGEPWREQKTVLPDRLGHPTGLNQQQCWGRQIHLSQVISLDEVRFFTCNCTWRRTCSTQKIDMI